MGVQVGEGAGFDAGDGEAEADHAGTVVGAEDVAADFADDDEEAQGEQFEIGKAPDFALEGDDGFELVEMEELAELY